MRQAWGIKQWVGLAAVCVAGALCGLAISWLTSPFHRLCTHSVSGEWSDCSRVLGMWLHYPSGYWVTVLGGATVLGVAFCGIQVSRR
jgi:hypothetical protein